MTDSKRHGDPCGRPDGKPLCRWAMMYGVRVHNYAMIDDASDSETEERIGRAIQDAYQRGFRDGAETIERKLGA